jgi:hypothetical protein
MVLYLYDSISGASYSDAVSGDPPPIPVGEWIHLEVLLRQSQTEDGQIELWQDGTLLYDIRDVQTTLSDNVQWSVNNYSDRLDPPNVTIYIDDASISIPPEGTGS